MYGNIQLLKLLRNCLDHSVTLVRKFPKNPYIICSALILYICVCVPKNHRDTTHKLYQ